MATCKYCGEEIEWRKDGGKNIPLNANGTLHRQSCKGNSSAPADHQGTITGLLKSYCSGSATFQLRDGTHTYAITGGLAQEWKEAGFLLPPENHPDIWLEFQLDKTNFIQSNYKRVQKAAWASEPTAPITTIAKTPAPVSPEKPSEPCTSPTDAPVVPNEKDIWSAEREEFCNLLTSTGREGMSDLLQYLTEETDFFIAPSSTKYHDARDGGLLHHSLKTYHNLVALSRMFSEDYPADSLIVIGLLHDVCKVNFYKLERKPLPRLDEKGDPVLDEWGKKIWDVQMIYTVDDQYPLGHGEKSVIMLQRYIQLTDTEIFAVRWHMMAYDDSRNSYAGNLAITNAADKYRIIPLFHMADLAASFLEMRPSKEVQ